MILLFDAANTLIYKPAMYARFTDILKHHEFDVDIAYFKRIHKFLSECYAFPDRTSKDFYREFNKEILFALGIIPTSELLNEIFSACSYLPWEKYNDTKYIADLPGEKAVLSNFNDGLHKILYDLFGDSFIKIIVSENEKVRKPDPVFFQKTVEELGVEPSEIIFIGDSIKLDMVPANKVGMNAWLIDRDNNYPFYAKRIRSMEEIKNIL